MDIRTRVSAKGQVVIPKVIRQRHQMVAGRVLDVIETPEGVLLRPSAKGEGSSVDEAIAKLREIVRYEGPPVSIEDMNATIARMWAEGGPADW